MSLKLQYYVYDVFTTTAFCGNPLAIVHVPASVSITQEQKQAIAREFNFSETTFVHEESGPRVQSVFTTDIFTTYRELPFAGHPTIGTSLHLLSSQPDTSSIILRIKAGDTPVVRAGDGGSVRLQVPFDFKAHPPLEDQLLQNQTGLTRDDLAIFDIDDDECSCIDDVTAPLSFILIPP